MYEATAYSNPNLNKLIEAEIVRKPKLTETKRIEMAYIMAYKQETR